MQATITGGAAHGNEFTAIQAGDAKAIDTKTAVVGPTQFLGLACERVPAAGAAQDRRDRTRRLRLPGQGRPGQGRRLHPVIVFNRTGEDGCETLVNMLAVTDIPAIFVSRTDGFRILGAVARRLHVRQHRGGRWDADAAPGPAQPVNISAKFDGWGYTHMYRATPNSAKKLPEVAIYAPPENQDPGARRGLRRPERPRGRDRPGREPRLHLALRARHARAQVLDRAASRRSARSSRRAAPTTGASRSTR